MDMSEETQTRPRSQPPLTERQREALDFIRASIAARGYPPTLREIGDHMGIRSTNGVNDHVQGLVRKGFLVVDPKKNRAIRLAKGAAVSLAEEVRALGQLLGADLGAAGEPLPIDWKERCLAAAGRTAP